MESFDAEFFAETMYRDYPLCAHGSPPASSVFIIGI